jgi:hypothetical protein
MNITTESMARFIGGQLEIVGTGGDNYRYRGQIARIEVQDDPGQAGLGEQAATLHVEFEYICKFNHGVGYEPDENKPYELSLGISGVSDIGMNRVCVNCPVVGEMSVFYPPNHNKRVLPTGQMESDE